MKIYSFRQHFYSYILISVFFICINVVAQSNNNTKTKISNLTDKKFLPHMAIHQHKGCPENAYCSQQTGLQIYNWKQTLKTYKHIKELNNYRQKNGIPLRAWLSSTKYPKDNIIIWDSTCSLHNTENNIFKEATIFVKNSLKTKQNNVLFENAYLLIKDKIISYKIPRGQKGLYLNERSMIILNEENGKYFGLKIQPNHTIKITNIIHPPILPQPVECPKILITNYKPKIDSKTFYESYECKSIWNKKTNKLNVIMYGITCF